MTPLVIPFGPFRDQNWDHGRFHPWRGIFRNVLIFRALQVERKGFEPSTSALRTHRPALNGTKHPVTSHCGTMGYDLFSVILFWCLPVIPFAIPSEIPSGRNRDQKGPPTGRRAGHSGRLASAALTRALTAAQWPSGPSEAGPLLIPQGRSW